MMINTTTIKIYHQDSYYPWRGITVELTEIVDREHAKVYWKVNDEMYSRYMKAVERFEGLAKYYDKEVKA